MVPGRIGEHKTWAGDITCIATDEGWLYLSDVLDGRFTWDCEGSNEEIFCPGAVQ